MIRRRRKTKRREINKMTTTIKETVSYDIVIIGGGPAGLSAAIYAGRAQRRVLVLEKGLVGGQVAMTMDIANYPGFAEGIDGPQLAEKMRTQAERYGTEFKLAEAKDISHKEGEGFKVITGKEEISARAVIIATGSSPKELGVKGEVELRGRGVSYCGTCDAPFFRGKKILVVGGGDTALKESLHLTKFASEVTLVHRREAFRAEKIYQKQIMTNDKVKVMFNSELEEISGSPSVNSVKIKDNITKESHKIDVDGVFIFVGTNPNTELICKLIPKNCKGHIDTDRSMMCSIKGLFAIGDVREGSYRQVATAVGEGATAAMATEELFQDQEI